MFKLPAVTFAEAVTLTALTKPLPLSVRLLPVAVPIFGVVRLGLVANTTTSLDPVVLAKLICWPVTTIGLTPVYGTAALNSENDIPVVPMINIPVVATT